jgi:hypothetical protein
MPLVLLLSLALQASAPAPRERVLSVREVMENIELHDGREIVVTGWIDRCERLSCSLFDSKAEARKEWPRYWLSIGAKAWFDDFAGDRAPARITLRARFDARCVTDPREDLIAVCADRSNSLNPIAIVR